MPAEGVSRRGLFRGGIGQLLDEGSELIDAVAGPALAATDEEELSGPERYRRAAVAALGAPPRGGLSPLLDPVVEAVLARSGAAPGSTLLDAGEGDAAIAAARRGLAVTACDPAPGRVARGSELSAAAEAKVEWLVADLDQFPFEDQSFDHAVSCFGTTFCPAPDATLAELFRVVRANGTVTLATWSEAGFVGKALELGATHAPPPRGVERPARWGRYETLYRPLMGLSPHFDCSERTVRLELGSRERLWDALAGAPGPLAPASASLDASGREGLRDDVLALAERHGEADAGPVTLEAAYTLTTAIR